MIPTIYLTDLQDGDIVWNLLHRLHIEGIELPIIVLSSEADFTALEVGDVHVPRSPCRHPRGLEHAASQGGAVGDLVKFLGTEVIHKNMEGKHILYSVDRESFGEEGRHGGIVDGEDGDGLAAVDLGGEVGEGEVVVEGGELGVFGEYACNVMCLGCGGEEEEEEG